jgi:hypothetical protein
MSAVLLVIPVLLAAGPARSMGEAERLNYVRACLSEIRNERRGGVQVPLRTFLAPDTGFRYECEESLLRDDERERYRVQLTTERRMVEERQAAAQRAAAVSREDERREVESRLVRDTDRRQRLLDQCLTGGDCNLWALSPEQRQKVEQARAERNFQDCKAGKASCEPGLLTSAQRSIFDGSAEANRVRLAKQAAYAACLEQGGVCDEEGLDAEQRKVLAALRAAKRGGPGSAR